MFDRHLFMASTESATSSARVSHSNSSGRADRKIRPTSLSCSLNCDDFFLAPIFEHVRHCATTLYKRGGGLFCGPKSIACRTLSVYRRCKCSAPPPFSLSFAAWPHVFP